MWPNVLKVAKKFGSSAGNDYLCGHQTNRHMKQKEDIRLTNIWKRLRELEKAQLELSRKMREEGMIQAAELRDRLALGLTGAQAIDHYNDWMMLHGLSYLVIK